MADQPAPTPPPPSAPARPWQSPLLPPPAELSGRFPITDVSPASLGGRRPAAAAVGEAIPVRATAFREGHDSMGMTVRLHRPDGSLAETVRMAPEGIGMDGWLAHVRPTEVGDWTFTLEAWSSPWDTWVHRATIKVPAGVDVELEFAEGALLLERAAAQLPADVDSTVLATAASTLVATALPVPVRLAAGTDPSVAALLHRHPIREGVTESGPWPLRVQRRRALVGRLVRVLPAQRGRDARPAPLRHLPHRHGAASTPSRTWASTSCTCRRSIRSARINRKGPNNTLTPGPDDPGSPWAIGSSEGGHDAVHPDLGTIDDFDAFVARTRELGMEVALDLALQAAPDHPWVAAHQEWFTTRADGTIAYAENPPKKYQDIYPLNFDNDPEGLYAEVERVTRYWMDHDVRIFRVDNPHTKPLWVWDRLLEQHLRHRPGRAVPRGGVHPAAHDARARRGRLPAELHVLHVAQQPRRDRGVRQRAGRAGRVLHAPELLREHPGHPAGVPAVQRSCRLRHPRHPGRHPVPHLRRLQRVRAVRARRGAPGQRGVPRLREVPVPAP